MKGKSDFIMTLIMASVLAFFLIFKPIEFFGLEKQRKKEQKEKQLSINYAPEFEDSEALETKEMAEAKVFVSRPEETEDKVSLRFNEECSRVLGGLPIQFEETAKGVLITVPKVDHHKAKKVTFKKRVLEFSLIEDFEDGWYSLETIDKETFEIKIFK